MACGTSHADRGGDPLHLLDKVALFCLLVALFCYGRCHCRHSQKGLTLRDGGGETFQATAKPDDDLHVFLVPEVRFELTIDTQYFQEPGVVPRQN